MKIKLDSELKDFINNNTDKINSKTSKISESKKESVDPSVYYDPHPEDSLLTLIVKERINDRKINIKNLDFVDQRELNNYKRSLNIHRTMSINKFERWMDLMDEEWCLIYGDELKLWEEFKRQRKGEK